MIFTIIGACIISTSTNGTAATAATRTTRATASSHRIVVHWIAIIVAIAPVLVLRILIVIVAIVTGTWSTCIVSILVSIRRITIIETDKKKKKNDV